MFSALSDSMGVSATFHSKVLLTELVENCTAQICPVRVSSFKKFQALAVG